MNRLVCRSSSRQVAARCPSKLSSLNVTGKVSHVSSSITSGHRIRRHVAVASMPDTEEARSPLDAPQEWETPMPSRRPDIFPEFEKMKKVFLPKPLPGDPEMPDEEYEESIKRTIPGDPDPEQKPGEVADPEPVPEQPGQEPERKTDIPNAPE